jgi:molecular chaperone DnaK
MVGEAERHASEDAQRREQVETRNRADSMIFAAEKALRDYAEQIPEATRQNVEGKIEAVRKALEGSDANAIKRTSDELGTAMQEIGASMYGQQPGMGPQPGPDGGFGGDQQGYGEPNDEDVIEGDFTES